MDKVKKQKNKRKTKIFYKRDTVEVIEHKENCSITRKLIGMHGIVTNKDGKYVDVMISKTSFTLHRDELKLVMV